ncbi:hypothetical protein Q1695_008053 [Nippostrongylus brasiliensis]|nr:hypothetical protein Q1695_008053 [Nippostrongylus brasiliensis]
MQIGTAAHELGHALGFFHTHSRHDRDNNIIVVTNNIKDDWLDQFTLENKERNNNYGLPYDYGSLLQYGATSAIKEKGKPNMYSMVPNTTLYIETLGSPFISFIDLYMMNIHYNCTEKCPKVSWARCRNHGFPHPRDCSRCICPGGYGGDYCDEKPRGCGKVLEAKPTAQVFEDTVGVTTDTKVREDFMKCYYWITAPQGKKIQVRLLKFQPQGIAVDGCTYGGVEFKWQADQRLTGSRHCSKDDEGLVFNSTSNLMPIITSVYKERVREGCYGMAEGHMSEHLRGQVQDAIRVFEEDGCWSYVGKTGGKQDLSLGKGCDSIGTAAHELGHALGFFHTHSRHDRDNNIIVVTSNIKDDWLDQFTLENKERNNNYGLPYDYGSLLQYGATSAIKEKGKPNMYSMVPNTTLYIETLGSPFISFIDLYMMNIHYNCTEKCPKVSWARCRNHGFPHPRDCSRCICPGGYGGDYCDEKPRGCGEILKASAQPQVFEDTVGVTTDTKVREDFMKCHHWITAPQGKKIQVRLLKFQPQGIAVDGCTYGGVEFKWQADQRLTGSRHCSKDDEGLVFNSTSNLMPIITYNRIYATRTTIEYKYV